MTAPAWTTVEDAIHAWVAAGSGLAATSVVWEAQQGPRPAGPYISMRLGGVEAQGRDWVEVEAVPLVIADLALTFAADDLGTALAAHGRTTGDGPVRFTTSGTLPGGLALATDYWVIVVSPTTLKIAASFADAMAAVPVPVDITDAGTGSHTMSDTADTEKAGAEIRHVVRGPRRAVLTLQAFGGLAGTGHGVASPTAMLTAVLAAHRLPTVNAALTAAGIGVGSREPVRTLDGLLTSAVSEARATTMITLHLTAEVSELGTYFDQVEATNNVTTPATTITL